jgi:hypothetical protein
MSGSTVSKNNDPTLGEPVIDDDDEDDGATGNV